MGGALVPSGILALLAFGVNRSLRLTVVYVVLVGALGAVVILVAILRSAEGVFRFAGST